MTAHTVQRAAATTVLAAVLLLAACSASQPSSLCRPLVADVPVLEGPREGAAPGVRGQLVELWRVGGNAEAQNLSYPAAIAASVDGMVAIVDYQLAEVSVVDGSGRWLGRWGRKGRGPGELIMPVAAAWAGERLAVYDIEQARVVFYRAGLPAGADLAVEPSFAAPVVRAGEIPFVAVRPDGSVLLQYPTTFPAGMTRDTVAVPVLLLRPGASVPDTLVTPRVIAVSQDGRATPLPDSPLPRVSAGSEGWLATAAADGSYRILVHDSTHRAVRQVCRAVTALPVSAAERERAATSEIAAETGAIGRMLIGPAGELWVDRRRPDDFHGARGGELDVFDSDGAYRGSVRVPQGVSIQTISGARAWGIRFDADDVPEIIAYRVEFR